ncbi:glutathione S-transferase family protein [uncultured Litoreibacter sp.]|uniref:glutathione S-transferase family protein n=1 Tax=uncultured Litoreibacter sp. TaxID=1392394 RepID=UPI002613E705|nr:glutathione S-transferase family protein [uncultured Litoreibacter sp.]
MPTLYHAPNTRSTSILHLIEEMGIADQIDVLKVNIVREVDTEAADTRNPHPEKKVPYLIDGEDHLRERGAIVTYLTDMFPDTGLGRPVGHPQRGEFLSWLFYYQGVVEPVLLLSSAKIEHPLLHETFRDMDAVTASLTTALAHQPYLLGEDYSAVDLLLSSPFHWLPDAVPPLPPIQDWIKRCANRPALAKVMQKEGANTQA